MTNTNNTNTEMTAIVADIMHGDGETSWLVAKLRINDSAITVTYGTRRHAYGDVFHPTSFKYYSLNDTSWSTLTRCLYDALSMTTMLEAARYAVGDETAYLIQLDGDKLLKKEFIAWRDGLRKDRPFSENINIKGSR